ncbi:hypothetical protein RQP46_006690 [Phenoliferia psychrophenolica]
MEQSEKKPLKSLPDEMWIEVLSSDLDFFDLLSVGGVSKKFEALVKAQRFDEVLFRAGSSPVLGNVPSGTKVKLHPILHRCSSFVGTTFDSFKVFLERHHRARRFECITISDLACSHDLASWPLLKSINLEKMYGRGGIGGGGTIKNPTGVTVLDLLKGVAAAWDQQVTLPDWYWDGEDGEDMSYIEALSDRNGWTGWSTPKIRAGVVTLSTDGYDSSLPGTLVLSIKEFFTA